MNLALGSRSFATAAWLTAMFGIAYGVGSATGTARIQATDGSTKTYRNVHIAVWDEDLVITSRDGQGSVAFGKASCTKIGELVRCLPWDATLFQNGERRHIALQSGTVWLNPSSTSQQLSHSSTQLPPRGVVLAVRTKRGTYVTLTGVVDEVHR